MKAIFFSFIEDKYKNALLRDLALASVFFLIAILFQSAQFYLDHNFEMWIGTSTGFALGFAIRSMIAMRAMQREQ
ncbi:MAG: hypothetical protein ACYC9J_06320 [Sulfuricaulis sp.]